MPLLDEPDAPRRSGRWPLILVITVVVVALGYAGFRLLGPSRETAVQEPPVERAAPAQPAAPVAAAPAPAPVPEAAPRRRAPRRPAPKPVPAAPAPAPAPTTGTLTVDSDVPGALVFIDRRYIGKAPITQPGIAAGSHRLNVSVSGYDPYANTIDVKPGAQQVDVRFKDITLHQAIQVIHKHAFGSCQGTLQATPDGLQYITTHTPDAFDVPLSRLEVFKVDYLKNNLEIKVRGGRTYNFTEQKGGPNVLFVFHQKVQHAIDMLKKVGKLK